MRRVGGHERTREMVRNAMRGGNALWRVEGDERWRFGEWEVLKGGDEDLLFGIKKRRLRKDRIFEL